MIIHYDIGGDFECLKADCQWRGHHLSRDLSGQLYAHWIFCAAVGYGEFFYSVYLKCKEL